MRVLSEDFLHSRFNLSVVANYVTFCDYTPILVEFLMIVFCHNLMIVC